MTVQQMQARFRQADPNFGPLPFWWWSGDEVTAERVRWQLQKFRSGGIRNIGIINIAPTGPQYGSDSDRPALFIEEWWSMFAVAVREAERLGMRIYFYDQIGFSGSNFPARIVSEHPECAGYVLRRVAKGEAVPDGAKMLYETDSHDYVQVRQGFNWLDKKAAARLFDRVHGEFERRFARDLGKTIAGSFQDELPPMPLWSPELASRYERTYGESIIKQLPHLFDDLPGCETVRRRVYELAAELAEEAFFIPISKWHDKYNMILCSDQAGPGRRAEVHGAQRLYLDYFRTHRWYNAAGCDMDGEIKAHSSMEHLHGGKRTFLEAFHTSGWGGTIEETLHWLIPWFREGANLYSPHAVYYSTRGGWWEWAPPDTGWRQPYFEHYSVFADTVSRVCQLLSEGTHAAEIAVHYPSHVVSGFMSLDDGKPTDHPMKVSASIPNEKIGHIHETYLQVTGRTNRKDQYNHGILRKAKLDFDIADDSALEKAVIAGGRLRIADETFRVLLLCGTTVMDDAAFDKVTAWIDAGGKVIAISVPEAERTLEGAIYVETAEEALPLVQSIAPSRVEGNGLSLYRRTDDADIFLLLPDDGELLPMHQPADRSFTLQESSVYRLKTSGSPQLWDPVSGSISQMTYERDGDWIIVEVPFKSWPAALVVCSNVKQISNGSLQASVQPSYRTVKPAAAAAYLEGKKSRQIAPDAWHVTAIPTLDNRYGDFDLHGDRNEFNPIEIRTVKVNRESGARAGIEAGWHVSSYDDERWTTRLWSEAAYWIISKESSFAPDQSRPAVYSNTLGDMCYRSWAGRMGKVPRRFLNLGKVEKDDIIWAKTYVIVPEDGRYFVRFESNAQLTAWIGGEELKLSGGPEEQTTFVQLAKGSHELKIRAVALKKGHVRASAELNRTARPSLPKWISSASGKLNTTLVKVIQSDGAIEPEEVRLVFAARGRVALYVNDTKVTEHGDFNPYIRQGQEEVDVTKLWKKGRNELTFIFPEGSGEALADGFVRLTNGEVTTFCTGEDWIDEHRNAAVIYHGSVLQFAESETLWLNPQPHPLANVGWLMPESVPNPKPLSFHPNPDQIGQPVWLRFQLPVGAHKMKIACAGKYRVWIDGHEIPVRDGMAQFSPQPANTTAAIRVEPDGPYTEADVLLAPIRFETVPVKGSLGDWRSALGLRHHSGAVEYETEIELRGGKQSVLELGHVRGTAEVWLDDEPLGVRAWRPYQFDLGHRSDSLYRLRIRVTNTLGTHYEEGRPSDNVGGGTYYYTQDNDPSWPDLYASGGLFGPVQIFEV